MGVASAVMQGMDCASLYNLKVMHRKQNSFGPQRVISKATSHPHVPAHAY